MWESRREFVRILAATAGIAAAGSGMMLAQIRPTYQNPPAPADPQERDKNADAPDLQTPNRAVMIKNEREFRVGVERFEQGTGERREELQKTTTTNVLSVRMYKKTEEIEKLAKQLKGKVRGN